MRLYNMRNPIIPECADVTVPGGKTSYVRCPACGGAIAHPRPTRQTLEWMEGADQVCDLVWPALPLVPGQVLVQDKVRALLSGEPVEWNEVDWYQDPKLRPPKRPSKGRNRRVWLPYNGPNLHLLWITSWARADLEHSTLVEVGQCADCGRTRRTLIGDEEKSHRWDSKQMKLVPYGHPRQPGKGVFVTDVFFKGTNICRIAELPGMIVVTERIKTIFEENSIGNVQFLEIGETV